MMPPSTGGQENAISNAIDLNSSNAIFSIIAGNPQFFFPSTPGILEGFRNTSNANDCAEKKIFLCRKLCITERIYFNISVVKPEVEKEWKLAS